jgi:hypothetical protein
MSEFVLIFRRDYKTKMIQPQTEGLVVHVNLWQQWLEKLNCSGRIAYPICLLDREGRILKSNEKVNYGPHIELRESMGGIMFINAESYEQVIEIVNDCPIFGLGGNIEIRKGFSKEQ